MAKALWFSHQGQAVLEDAKLLPSSSDNCHIRTLFSAISPGTEQLVYQGAVPIQLHQQMRCPYMEGEFTFPIKYGYSLVGEVVSGPAEILQQIVHVLHPHQDHCVVAAADVFIVPATVPPTRATLASNMETAVTALWDAQIAIGERVLVVGFGIIGSLIARLCSFFPGVSLEVVDISEGKIELAKKMGFQAGQTSEQIFDVAFHCSSSADGLQTAVESVGFEGRIIEVSWFGDRGATLYLGGSFHCQRKRIISSQVSNIPALQRPRWDILRRKQLVFSLLQRDEFDQHITATTPFADLPVLFNSESQRLKQGLAHLVEYINRRNSTGG